MDKKSMRKNIEAALILLDLYALPYLLETKPFNDGEQEEVKNALKTLKNLIDFKEPVYSNNPVEEDTNNTIKSIREVFGIEFSKNDWNKWDGFEIKAGNDIYHILIENGQHCCESFGYFSTNDDLDYFIGAKIIDFNVVNTDLHVREIFEKHTGSNYDGYGYDNIMFFNVNTNKGLLQFAVYNIHNGYYGHDIRVLKNAEIIKEDTL